MTQHVKVLGILHIALGGLSVLAGVFVMVIMGGIAGLVGLTDHSHDAFIAIPILGTIGGIVLIALTLLGLPGIIAGWGLLYYQPWARILTIVLSAFDLLNVPFGTALGVYGFWVLLSAEGERLFVQPPARYAARPQY